jgi:hypothetical protein
MRLVVLRPALALCVVLAFAVPAAATVAFNVTEEDIDAVSNPQAVTLADVNGDGLDDAIIVEFGDVVSIFLNDGEGVLEFDDTYDTAEGGIAVATGQFNADSFIDIVVVNNEAGTIIALLNNGEGVFDEEDPRQALVGANPIGVAVADFNDDTRDDLAVLSPDLIYLLQGNGDGTFSAFNPATVSTRNNDSFAIAAGNLDGENDNVDLAVTNRGSGQVAVFLGNGNGSFNFSGSPNAGPEPTGLVIADADGNQNNDIIVALSQGDITTEMALMRSTFNDGAFDMRTLFTGPEEPLALTGLDVEGNGTVDLAITSMLGGDIFVLCQPSDFCNGSAVEAGIWRSAIGGTVRGCADARQVAIASGKLNGDDNDDFVVLKGDDDDSIDTLCVALNQSSPGNTPVPTPVTPGEETPTPTGPTATATVTPTRTNTATPTEVPTIGLGVCNTKNKSQFPDPGRPVALANGDFDRDGIQDIAVADAIGNRVLILGTTFRTPGPSVTPDPNDACDDLNLQLESEIQVGGPEALASADFDRNGTADLAVLGSNGLNIYFGNGSGGFTPSAANPLSAGSNPSSIALADLDRDFTPDLIVTDSNSLSISIFLGTRQQAQPFDGPCPMPVQGQTNAAVSIDLNNDGRNDFAVTSPQTRNVAAFLQVSNAQLLCGSMASSFQGQTALSLPGNPIGFVAGTFSSGDTIPDLVVAMTKQDANGTVLLFEGRVAGSGVTYQRGTETIVPTPIPSGGFTVPSAIGTGDIERDGRIDLLITDGGNDTLAEFRGVPSGGLGSPLVPQSVDGEDPVALVVVDLDRDGRDDVVVANADDGSLSYMLSDQRAPTPTPTDTPIPTPTTPPPTVGSPTASPTISPTATRSRRPSSTPTPVPTNTQRGVVSLSGNGCSIGDQSGDVGWLFLISFALAAALVRGTAVARLRG